MKILLDESVPKPLSHHLIGNECTSVQERGWSRLTNGELLRQATPDFDLFITCDQNIRYQQNLAKHEIAILQLSTNDLRRIQAAMALIQSAVDSMQKRDFKVLEIS